MNIPNFCSRMLLEHSNLKATFFYSRKIAFKFECSIAFWSRNLVCSFDSDFLIAEQFSIGWRLTVCSSNLSTISKELFFCFEGWVFLALLGLGLAIFLLLKDAMGVFQLSDFWAQFWSPFLGLNFWTLERKNDKKCPQNWSQNWPPKPDQKFEYFSNALPPSRAKRLPI